MTTPKVLIPMSDYGHDPTETSVPYTAFKKAGFEVHFATENGKTPECDRRMLRGITQKLLGATSTAVNAYDAMATTPEFTKPLSWSASDFSLEPYNLVFLPGGHEKGVRQLIDSPIMSKHLASYFPKTLKPSNKNVAAVCHGVLALAVAKLVDGKNAGKSILHECNTTALPGTFEGVAFWGTRLFLGDYYKTYGVGSDSVETAVGILRSAYCVESCWTDVNQVRKVLDNPDKQYKNSIGPSPFVVEDEKYNYISARFPGDADLLAEKIVSMVKANVI